MHIMQCLKHSSLHGLSRVKSANKRNCKLTGHNTTPTYLEIWPFILPCYGNPFNLNKWFKRKLKKDKFSSLLFPLSLLQKLTQQWSWAMLACNLHSKHCNVTQNLYLLPVQPRFGALHNPRWCCVIKVYTVAMTYCNL